MGAYILRRLLYSIPIIFGVMVITFILFFYVTDPNGIAEQILGEKVKPEARRNWIISKGLDKPYYINLKANGFNVITDTLFFNHIKSLATFNFGNSYEDDKPIIEKIKKRALPSLCITIPLFIMGLFFSVAFSLLFAFFRGTYIDRYGTLLCVMAMSISILIYIIFFQWLISIVLHLLPVSGWGSGMDITRFILMPVIIGLVAGLGGDIRFYRTVMLQETTLDYVRTARAKGVSESIILFKHILKNAMIPILTKVVSAIPFLFMGSLLLENFFGIPGLGSFTLDALFANDFQALKAMIYIGAILYQFGIIVTDISYTLVDPRIIFE